MSIGVPERSNTSASLRSRSGSSADRRKTSSGPVFPRGYLAWCHPSSCAAIRGDAASRSTRLRHLVRRVRGAKQRPHGLHTPVGPIHGNTLAGSRHRRAVEVSAARCALAVALALTRLGCGRHALGLTDRSKLIGAAVTALSGRTEPALGQHVTSTMQATAKKLAGSTPDTSKKRFVGPSRICHVGLWRAETRLGTVSRCEPRLTAGLGGGYRPRATISDMSLDMLAKCRAHVLSRTIDRNRDVRRPRQAHGARRPGRASAGPHDRAESHVVHGGRQRKQLEG